MKDISYWHALKPLTKSSFWLLGIAVGLTTIYKTLLWRSGDRAHLGMSILFGLAVVSLLWDKRRSLNLESDPISIGLGTLLMSWILWQSTDLIADNTLRILPFISALTLGLIASGYKGLKQYWQELTILFFLGVPSVILSFLVDLSPLTAKFSAFLLWLSGFKVSLQGVNVNLPTGGIRVYSGCSGIESMTYLLGLAVICWAMFPIKRSQQIFVSIVAVVLGFVINGLRVALLAVLSVSDNETAFDYWHEGDGSLIFGAIAVFTFGLFYLFLLRQSEP